MIDDENMQAEPDATSSGAVLARELLDQKEPIADKPKSVESVLAELQTKLDREIKVEKSEHGYPVVDLLSEEPARAMELLRAIDAELHPVYHGMHNNEFRQGAGMPDIDTWAGLDPAYSHQQGERAAVYATANLNGGLAHTVLEHRFADQNPTNGETFALKPVPAESGQFIETSPRLASAIAAGEAPFTDGLLYILPPSELSQTPNSSHEFFSKEKVRPLAVVRVSGSLGPSVVNPGTIEVRE